MVETALQRHSTENSNWQQCKNSENTIRKGPFSLLLLWIVTKSTSSLFSDRYFLQLPIDAREEDLGFQLTRKKSNRVKRKVILMRFWTVLNEVIN